MSGYSEFNPTGDSLRLAAVCGTSRSTSSPIETNCPDGAAQERGPFLKAKIMITLEVREFHG